jgi:acetyl esterase/lipase
MKKAIKLIIAIILVNFLSVNSENPVKVDEKNNESSGVRILKDIEYSKVSDQVQLLDLYIPENKTEKFPLVVWIHGGGWTGGNKEKCRAEFLITKGFAVASINYRLSRVAKFPAQINDCKAALRFLRAKSAEYNIDPNHIGVWGSSAGGHLAALLGTTAGVKELESNGGNENHSSEVQAVCDFSGPTDFLTYLYSVDEKTKKNSPVTMLLGLPFDGNQNAFAKASPVTYVKEDKTFPPFLIMHGDQDSVVPVSQSIDFSEALKKIGCDVTLHIINGAGHGFGSEKINAEVVNFFDKHLKNKPE